MFYDILDQRRIDILPLLKSFQDTFYLAGGTALALQLGHRDSIDFDFFTQKDIDITTLFEKIREVFADHGVVKIQEELNTLTVLIDDSIKLSFFTYKYSLIKATVVDEYITLASVEDIACMKLSAITGRATNKDYIDLYFILGLFSLSEILGLAQEKYPQLDRNLLLKSLVYFDDITQETILFKNNKEVSFGEVRKRLQSEVKKCINL